LVLSRVRLIRVNLVLVNLNPINDTYIHTVPQSVATKNEKSHSTFDIWNILQKTPTNFGGVSANRKWFHVNTKYERLHRCWRAGSAQIRGMCATLLWPVPFCSFSFQQPHAESAALCCQTLLQSTKLQAGLWRARSCVVAGRGRTGRLGSSKVAGLSV